LVRSGRSEVVSVSASRLHLEVAEGANSRGLEVPEAWKFQRPGSEEVLPFVAKRLVNFHFTFSKFILRYINSYVLIDL